MGLEIVHSEASGVLANILELGAYVWFVVGSLDSLDRAATSV